MCLALAVAGLLAAGMFGLYLLGHYYVILVPFICALFVAGMARLTIAKGHCRNWLVGSLAGGLLGLWLYFGSYYAGMIYSFGPEAALMPEAFLRYIQMRLATDVTRDAYESGKASKSVKTRSGSEGLNWFRFGIESIGAVSIVAFSAYRRSRKTYCEHCNRWLHRESTPFEPEKTADLLQSLQTGSARQLAALCANSPFATIPNTTLAIDYCPSLKEGRARDCPVYASIKYIAASPKGLTLDPFEQSKGKLLEACVQLSSTELPALAPRFPLFETYAGRAAVASLLPQQQILESDEESNPKENLASISPLNSEHYAKVLTRKRILLGNLFCIAGLLGFIGGLGLLAWGASILERDEILSPHKAGALGIVLCVIGGLSLITALAGMLFDSTFGGNRLLKKSFKEELARRTSLLVDPDDPAALFVEVVPKSNWGKMVLENATDIGLLLVDRQHQEVRFEGDKERWRIPGNSITHCELETFVHGHGAGATKLFYVVLRANKREGFWEAPVRERRGTGLMSSKRKKSANQLAADITSISQQNPKADRWPDKITR